MSQILRVLPKSCPCNRDVMDIPPEMNFANEPFILSQGMSPPKPSPIIPACTIALTSPQFLKNIESNFGINEGQYDGLTNCVLQAGDDDRKIFACLSKYGNAKFQNLIHTIINSCGSEDGAQAAYCALDQLNKVDPQLVKLLAPCLKNLPLIPLQIPSTPLIPKNKTNWTEILIIIFSVIAGIFLFVIIFDLIRKNKKTGLPGKF